MIIKLAVKMYILKLLITRFKKEGSNKIITNYFKIRTQYLFYTNIN